MKRIYLLIFIFTSITLYSQDNKKWTLQECMRYAVENSPRKNKQESLYNIQKQDYKEAIGKLLPSVNAQTNAYFNYGRGLAENNSYVDMNSFSNNYELSSSITLFRAFSNINKLKMTKMGKLTGKNQLQETEDLIAYETMEAYFNVLYFEGLVQLAEQQVAESEHMLKQMIRMEELGVKGFPDVAEVRAKHAQDQYNLTRQKNQLLIGVIQLKEKMNFPVDAVLQIGEYESDGLIAKTDETPFAVYENALSHLPKALVAESSFQAQKFSYRSAKGYLFPSLTLSAGYSSNFFRYTNDENYVSFKDQLKDKRGAYVGVTLSIPVFNGFSASAEAGRNKARMIISQYEKDETLRAIYSEIEQALADMNGQADEYYQAGKQVEAMLAAHDVNVRKHKEGLISTIELNTSANRLLQAKVEELNARLKFYLKQQLVNYYKGEPYIN